TGFKTQLCLQLALVLIDVVLFVVFAVTLQFIVVVQLILGVKALGLQISSFVHFRRQVIVVLFHGRTSLPGQMRSFSSMQNRAHSHTEPPMPEYRAPGAYVDETSL